MLAQLPAASLERHMALPDWQAVLELGLAGPLPTGGGKAGAPGKHAAAIHVAAQALLLRHLGLLAAPAALGEEGWDGVPPTDDEEEQWAGTVGRPAGASGEAMEDGSGSQRAAWQARLQALQALPPHAEGCSVAARLGEAWAVAAAVAATAASGAATEAAEAQGAEEELEGEQGADLMWD